MTVIITITYGEHRPGHFNGGPFARVDPGDARVDPGHARADPEIEGTLIKKSLTWNLTILISKLNYEILFEFIDLSRFQQPVDGKVDRPRGNQK